MGSSLRVLLLPDALSTNRMVRTTAVNYSAILDTYELSDIIEMNDLTQEDVLEYLVEKNVLRLPEIMPVVIDD